MCVCVCVRVCVCVCVCVQVFFAVLVGAFALGQAMPNLENLTSAAGASIVIYQIIDRVCPYLYYQSSVFDVSVCCVCRCQR